MKYSTPPVKTKDIRQELMIKASAHAVYEALMDSKQHTKFTGQPAKISPKVGGTFTAYGDYISGKNIELVKDKRIVQNWRASDWPKGHYSEVTYILKEIKGGTKLVFSHKGIPASYARSIAYGWRTYYWHPLKLILEK